MLRLHFIKKKRSIFNGLNRSVYPSITALKGKSIKVRLDKSHQSLCFCNSSKLNSSNANDGQKLDEEELKSNCATTRNSLDYTLSSSNREQFSGANPDILAQMFRSHPNQRYDVDIESDHGIQNQRNTDISTKNANGETFEYFTPLQEEINEFERKEQELLANTYSSDLDGFEKENELLRKRNEKLRRLKREEEREDRHRHAQHRKYLSHPDLPLGGTVFQRDQLNKKLRLAEAKSSVHQHKIEQLGIPVQLKKDAGQNKWNLRGKKSVHAVVEDQIQVSMLSGEFDRIDEGLKGKPLERKRTPGVNNTEDIFVDILRRNGIKPEWIQRQQDLNEMDRLLRERIEAEWALYFIENENKLTGGGESSSDSSFKSALIDKVEYKGEENYNKIQSTKKENRIFIHEKDIYEEFRRRVLQLHSLQSDVAFVNRQIVTYNLQVPSTSLQRFHIKIENLIQSVITSSSFIQETNSSDEAREIIRRLRFDGSLGITCLVEFRAQELNLDLYTGVQGNSYQQVGTGSSMYPWHARRRKKEKPDPLMYLVMAPIDIFANYLSKRLNF